LETVLQGAFSLWFIFPDFSTGRFYFYSHFGVLFHRIYFFPKFSEEVCGFVRAGFCGVSLPQLWICEHSGMFFPSCAYCYVFRFPCELACLTNVS
jgi:hypothetical protein